MPEVGAKGEMVQEGTVPYAERQSPRCCLCYNGSMILKHRDMELLRFDWLEPQGDRVVSVTEENRRLLPNMKTDPFVTADEVAELLGVSRRTVLREIARLREEVRITRVGSDKTGHGVVK